MAQRSNQLTNYFLTLTLLISLSFTLTITNTFKAPECNSTATVINMELGTSAIGDNYGKSFSMLEQVDCQKQFTIEKRLGKHQLSGNGKSMVTSGEQNEKCELMNYQGFYAEMTKLFADNDKFFYDIRVNQVDDVYECTFSYLGKNDTEEFLTAFKKEEMKAEQQQVKAEQQQVQSIKQNIQNNMQQHISKQMNNLLI